jgi:hypothetical protein
VVDRDELYFAAISYHPPDFGPIRLRAVKASIFSQEREKRGDRPR